MAQSFKSFPLIFQKGTQMKLRLSKKNHLLEIAKLTGLVIWYLLISVSWALSPKETTPLKEILLTRLIQTVAGYIIITLYYLILNALDKKEWLSKKLVFFLLLPVCCIVAFFWNVVSEEMGRLFRFETFNFLSFFYFLSTFYYLLPTLAFTGVYYAISYWLNFNHQRDKAQLATNLANEAQLQMLRYQINPHFLFNALNTIRMMVEEDKEVARQMITELAGFFRFSLSQKNEITTFENEISAIKNYLEIQKIRFEEKLVVSYDIDERLNAMKLPFFIVLPLVENAVKYGLQTSRMPLTIKISARLSSQIEISVQNTGRLVPPKISEEGTNTGTENIRKRLELSYPGNFSFLISEKDSWVTAQILIKNTNNPLK